MFSYRFVVIVYLLFSACALNQQGSFNPVLQQRLLNQGVIALRSGNFQKAAVNFELAGEIALNAQVYNAYACLAIYLQKYRVAEKYFLKALSLFPGDPDTLRNFAFLKMEQGKTEQARKLYEMILDKTPQDYKAHNNYASLNYLLGNNKLTLEHLEKAAVLTKSSVVTNNLNKLSTVLQK